MRDPVARESDAYVRWEETRLAYGYLPNARDSFRAGWFERDREDRALTDHVAHFRAWLEAHDIRLESDGEAFLARVEEARSE